MNIIKNFNYTYFAHLIKHPNYHDFSLIEFKSLFNMFNLQFYIDDNYCYNLEKNSLLKFYTNIELNKNNLNELMQRTILIKNIFYSYDSDIDINNLINKLKLNNKLKNEEESLETFRFDIEGLDKSFDTKEQKDLMLKFEVIDFKAKVNLKNPERQFKLYFNKADGIYNFGKIIVRSDEKAYFYNKFNLRQRKYLGPTSTDNKLAFLMVLFYYNNYNNLNYILKANYAQVKKHDLVLDPFTGTGSLLIPSSYFGYVYIYY